MPAIVSQVDSMRMRLKKEGEYADAQSKGPVQAAMEAQADAIHEQTRYMRECDQKNTEALNRLAVGFAYLAKAVQTQHSVDEEWKVTVGKSDSGSKEYSFKRVK